MNNETRVLLNRARRLIQVAKDGTERVGKSHHKAPINDIAREIHALEDAADRLEHGAPQVRRTSYKSTTIKEYSGEEVKESHESFGLVGFYRSQGSRRLFGSHIENHASFITMRVHRAARRHGLSRDWYGTDGGRLPIVEVCMSAAQFAQAITSMNMGEGVPCTIESVEGISMEEVPAEVVAENVKIRAGFEEKIGGVVQLLAEAHKEMDGVVESKSTISKGRARDMVAILGKALQEMRSNAPFVVSSFQESAEKVVTSAKAEIEAFTALALRRAGMEHMRLQAPEETKKLMDKACCSNEDLDDMGNCSSCGAPDFR